MRIDKMMNYKKHRQFFHINRHFLHVLYGDKDVFLPCRF